MKDNEIKLSASEMIMAVMVGVMREMESIRRSDSKHSYGAKDDNAWQIHIEGAMGECAVAKYLNIFWGKGSRGASDVGEHEVRTTASHSNRLMLHPDDNDDVRFYLVTGVLGKYVVRGWILGKDGKNPKFWEDPTRDNRPAFFVPRAAFGLNGPNVEFQGW